MDKKGKSLILFGILFLLIITTFSIFVLADGFLDLGDLGKSEEKIADVKDFYGNSVSGKESYIWNVEPSILTYKNPDGTYTKTLLSGTQYVKDTDGKWKHIENATSLKNSDIKIKFIEDDPDYEVEIIDYNLTSITYNLKIKDKDKNKDIQIRVWDINQSLKSEKINEKTSGKDDKGKEKDKEWKDEKDIELGYKEYSEKKEDKFVRQLENSKEYTQEFGIGKILEIGPNSTTITLQTADTENLDDAQAWKTIPDDTSGGDDKIWVRDSTVANGETIVWLKFNTSTINKYASSINHANLTLYYGLSTHGTVGIWNSSNLTWAEETLTWNNAPFSSINPTVLDSVGTGANPFVFNVTSAINPSETAVSFVLRNDSTNDVSVGIYSKEYTTDTSYRPKLTITYTPYIDILSPTPSQIFTEDSPTARFNISTAVNMDKCYYELDGVNFTMNKKNDTSFNLTNTTLSDGSHFVRFWCNQTSDGVWRESSNVSFDVDSVNITKCRDLTVSRTYSVLNNISSSNDCLIIKNSNINLNLSGYSVISSLNNAIDIQSSSYDNAYIYNGYLNGSTIAFNTVSGSDLNNLTNVTFLQGTDSGAGQVYRKWYFDYKVNSSSGNIDTALVAIYDKDNNLVFSPSTNSSGQITQQQLTEYVNNGGAKTYSSPYTVNVSKTNYITNSTVYNLTTRTNVNTFVTLQLANVAPTSALYSPADNYWSQSLANDYICNLSDTDGNLKNVTIYAWKSGTTLSTTQNISGSTNSTPFSAFAVSTDGAWLWNCLVYDDAGLSAWAASNRTINIDTVNPVISYGTNTENNNTYFKRNYIYTNTSITETNFKNVTFYLYNSSKVLQSSYTYTTKITYQNFTSLSNGVYYYNVTVFDNSSRTASTETYTITLDTVNPQISYNSDTQASGWIKYNFIFVNITASDTNKDSVWFTWNNVNETFATQSNNFSWENKTGLSDGTYVFSAGVNDSAGNSNITSNRTVYLDTTNPLIEWSTGVKANDTNYSQSNIYFNVSKTEVNCNKTVFYWRLAGGSWSSYNSTACITEYNKTGLSDGTYEYYVLIVDNATNQNQTTTKTIRLDTTAPSLTIFFPLHLDTYNHHNQTLNFSASDSLVGLSMCWKQLNSGSNVTIDCSLNSTVNTSTEITIEGTNTIYLWANDTLGHLASAHSQFGVSTTSPAITLDFPPEQAWLNYGTNIYLNYTATDTDGVSSCELWGNFTGTWAKNSTNTSVVSGKQDFIKVNLPDGKYIWNVWCNDTLDNGGFSEANKTFNVDTTYPLIGYSTGTENDNTNLSQTFIYVNISVTETNFQNITYRLFTDAGDVNTTTYTSLITEINFTGLSSDEYFYQVNISDKSSNFNNTLIREITLDTVNPSIALINPQNGTINLTTSQNFTATFTDNMGLKNATLYIYGAGEENITTINFNEDIISQENGIVVDLIEGIKHWWYIAWDWAGNSYTSENRTLTIDTTPPSVVDNSYYPLVIYNETSVTIYGNVSDTYLDKIWIEINSSGSYQNVTVTTHTGDMYIYALTSSETSNHENISWMWWANDTAGNLNSSILNYFVVSNRNPVNLTISTPANDSYINTDYLTINFTADDEDYDSLNYSIYYGNGTLFNFTTENTINFTGFNSTDTAINQFYVNVSDGYLTNQSVNYTFTIDKTLPGLIINKPDASPVMQCSLSNVYLNITTNDSNLDYCSYNVTFGTSISTPTTTFNCSNTYFNVTFDSAVQLLSLTSFDKAGNFNTTTRYLYFNTGHSSCAIITPPIISGGGTPPPLEPEVIDYGFCGDGICQDGTNGTIDRGENFYTCSIDCSVVLNLENINFETLFTNCISKDPQTREMCLWKTKPGLLTIFVIIVIFFLFAILFSIKTKTDGSVKKIMYNQKFFKRKKRY